MLRALLAVILTVLTLAATPVAAQQDQTLDFARWEEVATQAEQLIRDPDASDQQLEQTRQEIIEWRRKLGNAESINAEQIDTTKKQLAALGDPPAEGGIEDPEVAKRRTALNQQLSTLQAPQLTADEAYSRADALVAQISEIEEIREAVELARLSPSPLLPSSWKAAASDAARIIEGLASEIAQLARGEAWAGMAPQLPKVLSYLLAAVFLLTFGRRWVHSLPSRLSARSSDYSRAVVAFIVSLGQIVLPMIGLFLAIAALKASGLPGEWTEPVLDALPLAGVILFTGGWLSGQLFPRRAIAYDTLSMSDKIRNRARHMLNVVMTLFAIHHILAASALPLSGLYQAAEKDANRIPLELIDGAVSVFHFVQILIAAVALFRLGNAFRTLRASDETSFRPYRHKTLFVVGVLTRFIVVIAVLLAALGFINLANLLIWPWTLTISLICILILLQDFIADVFNMVKRGEEGAREGLGPLLIGFGLILLSVPLFLMVWGAGRDDLLEYWRKFQQGFSFGGITLSPKGVMVFLLIFLFGYAVTRGIQGMLRGSILPKTKLDIGGKNAIVAGVGYVGIGIAILIAITAAGIDLSSLAFIAGALTVGIGFGLQNIVSNFVSGIILLIERPISIGDWIDAGGQQGIVKRISVRSTQVETFDKTEVIVPNSDLITQSVTNWTRHNQTGRIIIPVGVAYGTDTRKVERILMDIIEDQPVVTVDPAPAVLFRGFGADSLEFEIRAILSDVTAGLGTTSEVCHQIAERFVAEGIEIPFAQRDIWLRNPEALRGEERPKPRIEPVTISDQGADRTPSRNDPRIAFDEADSGADMPDSDGGDGGGDR